VVSGLPAGWLIPMHATPEEPPPPFTAVRLLTEWRWDWALGVGLVVAAALYLVGVWKLHRRGDRWPVGRTVAFLLGGVGTVVVATMSGLGAYDTVLFSVHTVQHMLLMMMAPMFAALGAPVTLALRTLPSPPRRVLLAVLHSWPAKVVTFPPLVLAVFVASPFALYYSDFYELSLRSGWWHTFVHVHFLMIGAMLMWPLIGVDPVPGQVAYPFRVLMLFLLLPFHAFLGISIMSSSALIAGDWYLSFERTWPPTPLEDQYIAGSIMWGSGDIVAVVLLAAMFVQWFRQSQREAAREDRRLDRLQAAAQPGDGHDPARYDQAAVRHSDPSAMRSENR
jgi:cytochrome c oxidase assembly factor CtaG